MKIRNWLVLISSFAVIVLMLTGCAVSGTSYLALDYSTGFPTGLNFPAFPFSFNWGEYYQHSAGTYSGAYTNVALYSFTYTIEENSGVGFIFGAPGDDRYYTMWLETTGPELYFFDVSASLTGKSGARTESDQVQNGPFDTSLYDLDHPEPFSYERSFNGVTFRVSGNRYHLR